MTRENPNSNYLWCEPQTVVLRTNCLAAYNSGFKKLAVQWSNEHLCFVSSAVVAGSLVLRNPLLRQSPNHYASSMATPQIQLPNSRN